MHARFRWTEEAIFVMEELNARLQLETNRRGVFERKSAELECINDDLRLENRTLIAEVEELKEKLSSQLDDSEGDEDDETANGILSPGIHPDSSITVGAVIGNCGAVDRGAETNVLMNASTLVSNTNNSNINKMESSRLTISPRGEGGGSPRDIDIKVQTLKRKQKELKAELHDSLCKTTSYQEAFQEELDMRTRLEEKYESLRIRFDRLVEENDNMRTVLANHCINVPPHQQITGKRRLQHSDSQHLYLHSHPPSFVPQGRRKSTTSSNSINSSPSRVSKDQTPPPAGNDTDDKSKSSLTEITENERNSQLSFGHLGVTSESVLSEDGASGEVYSLSASRHSSSSSPSSSEDETLEHIVIQDPKITPTLSAIHKIDTALLATTNEIANAKCFYEHVRQIMKSGSESD